MCREPYPNLWALRVSSNLCRGGACLRPGGGRPRATRRCYTPAMDLEALPGGDLVRQGLDDLARGIESVPALLVSIGAPRLQRIGLPLPAALLDDPERRLYLHLAAEDSDSAHDRYNALVRRLVSFENAAECGGL
jgi:hypothetical protein